MGRYAAALARAAPSLTGAFDEAAARLEDLVTPVDVERFARTVADLAGRDRRGVEVAAGWLRAGPALAAGLGADGLRRGADVVRRLADLDLVLARAFTDALPVALERLAPSPEGLAALEAWAAGGRRLHHGTRRSATLAVRWFERGAVLPGLLEPADLDGLAEVTDRLAAASGDLAVEAVECAPVAFGSLGDTDRPAFVDLARALAGVATPDVLLLLERGPELLAAVAPDARGALLTVAALAVRTGRVGYAPVAAAVTALAVLPTREHAGLLSFVSRLADGAPRAALEALGSAAEVHERVGADGFRRWAEVGATLLVEDHHPAATETYFRLESTLATETLAALSVRVDFARVSNLLARYVQALAGERVTVHTTEALVARRLGWTNASAATTDGHAIHLPACVDRFDDPAANFRVYKVAATHQAGRLEFGSFGFRFGEPGASRRSTLAQREERAGGPRVDPSSPAALGMRRFFDLFEDRRLIGDLFTLVEDTRVATCIAGEYPGIAPALREVQSHEAQRRPDARRLALRQALVENLLRISLGRPDTTQWPARMLATLTRATDLLEVVRRPGATVQDSAEIAAALYDLAGTVPNVPPGRIEIVSTDGTPLDGLPYEGLGQPEFRGDFKPSIVQALDALADPTALTGDLADLRDLLADSPDLDGSAADLDDLARRLAAEAEERRPEGAVDDDEATADEADDDRTDIEWTWYDEWDFRAADYRGRWCRVGERRADDGGPDWYAETLKRHHGLVVETRRQFELLRPESFRRVRRLEDGHEIDLDQAIEFHADRKAGAGPLARFYYRRDKHERNVAVAFLLDVSGSTDDPVDAEAARGGRSTRSPRVVDVEKEAAVIAAEAVEAIGDTYAVYAFSGYGRSHVEFHVVKDFDDPLDDRARGRLGGLEPRRSTRMGPVIRHATAKLKVLDAKVKLLMLLSDGRPQDHNYGRDRNDHDYAVHDTKQSLVEARRAGVVPFLVTVDAEGHDYLREMCGDLGYEVVTDVESLPRRLPTLYRYLAAG